MRRVSITPEKKEPQAERAAEDEGLLQRHGRQNVPDITISYPVIGHTAVDEDVRRWVNSIADTFETEMSSLFRDSETLGETLDMSRYALHGSYSVLRPSQDAVSLVFEIWTYTGGAHGNLDIITLNYSLITGQRLNFVDIFEDVDKALSLLSEQSRKVLSRRLAGGAHGSVDPGRHDAGGGELFQSRPDPAGRARLLPALSGGRLGGRGRRKWTSLWMI